VSSGRPLLLPASVIAAGALVLAGGCGPGPIPATDGDLSSGDGFSLQAAGGTFYTGAALHGLNVLVTLRDENGAGPAEPWIVRVFAPGNAVPVELVYEDSSPGSFAAWWWEETPALTGSYVVEAVRAEGGGAASDGGAGATTLAAEVAIDADEVLNVPILGLDLRAPTARPRFSAASSMDRAGWSFTPSRPNGAVRSRRCRPGPTGRR